MEQVTLTERDGRGFLTARLQYQGAVLSVTAEIPPGGERGESV